MMYAEDHQPPVTLLDLVTLKQERGGFFRVSFPKEKRPVIFRLLKEAGFAFVRLNKRSLFIRRKLNDISHVGLYDLVHYFKDHLQTLDYNALPGETGYHDVLDAFYRTHPIKESNQVKTALASELSETERHSLLLKIDYGYVKAQRIQETLEHFEESAFKLTEDKIGTYHAGDQRLYYKAIGNRRYLVFNDIDRPEYHLRMFDCWVSTFAKESDIGKKKPITIEPIIVDFRWERDFELIRAYVQ